MAIVNTLSTIISNYDAQPRILTSGYIAGSGDTVGCGVVTLGATDSIGSTYRVAFIPSGVCFEGINIANTSSTTGAFSLGVYCNDQQTFNAKVSGTAVTAAPGAVPVTNAQLIFGTGITTSSARTVLTPIYSPTVLANAFAATNFNLRVWELLGLDSDPEYMFHLVLTCTTAPTGTATVAVQYQWLR